jgi:DNA polymerase elongation subunit (family B)
MFRDVNGMSNQEVKDELESLQNLLPYLNKNNVDLILNKTNKIDKKSLQTINCGISANGVLFNNTIRGFLPELMDQMYKDRKMFKNKMIDAKKNLEDINAEMKRRGLTK